MIPIRLPLDGFDAALRSVVVEGFVDRRDAGRQLAEEMKPFRSQDALVLGIHRGGVAVAAEIARFLEAELDVLIARKMGAPKEREIALGAVTADGARFTNVALLHTVGVSYRLFRILADEQRAEARRVEHRLREGRPPPRIAGRTVIVVDDGLATGATMRAALRSVRRSGPARVVVAVPAGASGDMRVTPSGGRRADLPAETRSVPGRRRVLRELHANRRRRGAAAVG